MNVSQYGFGTESSKKAKFQIDNSLLKPNDLMGDYEKPSFTDFMQLTHIGFSQFS